MNTRPRTRPFPRRLIAAILGMGALAVLGGCGFQPLYGDYQGRGSASNRLATVAIEPIPDRIGQLLRNALEQRFERSGPADKVYNLRIEELTESISSLGIQKDATATRANLTITADFMLLRDGTTVWGGTSQSTVSHNILNQQFASMMAETDSRARAVEQIANDITLRLAVFLNSPPADPR